MSFLLSCLSCEVMTILKHQASIICVFEALDGGHLRLKPEGTKTKVMEMLHNYCALIKLKKNQCADGLIKG